MCWDPSKLALEVCHPRLLRVIISLERVSIWRNVNHSIIWERCLTLLSEATWGADPLEYAGGFRNLSYDSKATFRSSLPTNGTAQWNVTEALKTSSNFNSANVSLSVSYSDVDWDFLKTVYGWAAVQYQAWARGELVVGGNETQHVILHTDAILEYWIDDQHYFGGDFYTFRRAPPVLHLKPGSHKIDIRLVRDVRAFGGILEPSIDVLVDVQKTSGTLELARRGILMSDVVDGKLASSIGSVSLRNSGEDDLEIIGIQASNVSFSFSYAGLSTGYQILTGSNMEVLTNDETSHSSTYDNTSIVLVAGQTRPVEINITLPSYDSSIVIYTITYRTTNAMRYSTLQVSQDVKHISTYRPHKITFPHPGGMVSYAMLRPPAKNATCRSGQTDSPILLAMHGAGLEADDPMVTGALDPVSDLCAWVLFPTGVTPWSGDDWHNWGFADVEAAIEAIPSWIKTVGWKGPGVDINRWIVTGHSNGGQGTWYALIHRPDKILAAAPLSGYASIQKYVPYELWQPADPRRTAVISASLNSYRHEMLMANIRGIPVQQQHGEIDDNVPAYNSRFLGQQLYLTGVNSSYNEVPERSHWWDGVMTTPELVRFYYSQTHNKDALPRKLDNFTMVVGNPGDTGSKGGIRVLQLRDPGQYGRVEAKGHTIKTSNIISLEFDPLLWRDTITINGAKVELGELMANPDAPMNIYNIGIEESFATSQKEATMSRRYGRQLGSMTAILRTQGHFVIRHAGLASTSHIALQVSRNLHQYFQADAVILPSLSDPRLSGSAGNIVTLAMNNSIPDLSPYFPIRLGNTGCSVRDHYGTKQEYGEAARGAGFLRPAGGERLELVLWGADEEGLRQAARVVPMLTGVGQPDFVVFGESTKWRGVEGVLAMGFFDSKWRITASSVVETM
jgi:predicted peptidase